MTDSPPQEPLLAEGAHLVLYDGVCGLCNRLLQFLLTHDRRSAFVFASLQSAVGEATVERFGNPHDLTSFCVLADYKTTRPRMFTKSGAALFVAGELAWPWKAAVMFGVLPTAILDRAYDLIARNRYRVFGRYEQCLIPGPEVRRRFIE